MVQFNVVQSPTLDKNYQFTIHINAKVVFEEVWIQILSDLTLKSEKLKRYKDECRLMTGFLFYNFLWTNIEGLLLFVFQTSDTVILLNKKIPYKKSEVY